MRLYHLLFKKYRLLFLVFFLISACTPAFAQTVNVDALTDAQIKQMMAQAQAAGLSDSEMIKQAQAKGMSAAQIQRLQERVSALKGNSASVQSDTTSANQEPRTVVGTKEQLNPPTLARSKIFGADLFRGSNTTFEPNLRIATPVNYILGPDDQLNINVYGNSLVNWSLKVSPEGTINIPGVGVLSVSGKTIEQASQNIKAKLAASNYAIGRGTSVQIALGNIRSIKVIVNGQVVKPGTITVPSLASVFTALYVSGGPNDNGSFRNIEIIRNNKIIRHLDVYDFLLKGDQKDNITLQDQDIIRVPTYKVRVELAGLVKIPALFEVLPGETLQDVIRFAGGFGDMAYTAKVKVVQISGQELRIVDIPESDYANYTPLRGDKYEVEGILDRYENRVTISGAVFRPGQFELNKGLTLSQLITKAAGLKEDAFTGRGYIVRLKPDNTTESISFSPIAIMNKTEPDIILKREDAVTISSLFDLRDKYSVTINGEIRNPGTFAYADSMSVEDLILKAGGFTEGASPRRIEVARRVFNSDPRLTSSNVAQVFSINVDEMLKKGTINFALKPFDIISVYALPGFEVQKTVKIEGEVLYPGNYTIQKKDEKLSDLVARAGGLTASADITGGRLTRIDKLGQNGLKGKVDINELNQERAEKIEHIKKTLNDSTSNASEQMQNNYVGIDLKKVLNNPGSINDLILEEGDVLRIPQKQQLVKVSGEVLLPSSVLYTGSSSLSGFVNHAGGFSSNALRRKAYVIYPNGTVQSTHSFLFFRSYPAVKPGSEIIIPKKPEKKGISIAELGTITAALASAAAVLIGVLSITRK